MFKIRNVYGSGGISMNDIADLKPPPLADSEANSLTSEVKNLRDDVSRTLMICETLWELLKENTELTDDDLHKKLYEIDMRDGVLDGNNKRKSVECSECKHMVSARHVACLYCGNIIDHSVF